MKLLSQITVIGLLILSSGCARHLAYHGAGYGYTGPAVRYNSYSVQPAYRYYDIPRQGYFVDQIRPRRDFGYYRRDHFNNPKRRIRNYENSRRWQGNRHQDHGRDRHSFNGRDRNRGQLDRKSPHSHRDSKQRRRNEYRDRGFARNENKHQINRGQDRQRAQSGRDQNPNEGRRRPDNRNNEQRRSPGGRRWQRNQ